MTQFLSFQKSLCAILILLLSGIFLQSCMEEMPILVPQNGTLTGTTGMVSSKSTISLNINNNPQNISNIKPNNIIFTNVTGGASLPLFKEYFIVGDNGNQTSSLSYSASFHTDTVGSKNFVFESSQLFFNKKTYTTFNISGTAKFNIEKLDDAANTVSGTFGYYVYDDILKPTDSVYVSGSFNILK